VARYIRLRTTAFTSGTVNAAVILRDNPLDLNVSYIVGSASINVVNTISTAATGISSLAIKTGTTVNATTVKNNAGNITDIVLTNNSTSVKYFKLYNKASAPVVATDTPFYKAAIAPGATVLLNFSFPIRLSTGIAYAITGGLADNDATVTAVDDVSGVINYV
jgi:hypothetical protein